MKVVDTLSLKKMSSLSIESIKSKLFNNKDNKNKVNQIKNGNNEQNQKNAPKEIRRGIGMTEEQKKLAQKIKDDIFDLYKDGYSIRMIANHYNDLYSTRNSKGEIVAEAISRETVRKILNGKEVSLKSILKNPNLEF